MAFRCPFDKKLPKQPSVSAFIFDSWLQEIENEPINSKEPTEEMAIELKSEPVVNLKPASATSIPDISKAFQDKYFAEMQHIFKLRQQHRINRQVLSYLRHQHDAALCIIAQLLKERIALQEELADITDTSTGIQQPESAAEAGATGRQHFQAEVATTIQELIEKECAAAATAERLTSEEAGIVLELIQKGSVPEARGTAKRLAAEEAGMIEEVIQEVQASLTESFLV